MESAHQRGWQIFEVVVGLPYLVAAALHLFVPLSLPSILLGPVGLGAATGLFVLGIGIVIAARRELSRQGQPTDPGHPTQRLVTSGVFSVSRNPLYLGGVLTLAGIAWFFNLVWALIALLPAMIACHFILIAPEEKYLIARFGDAYRTYVSTVSRWLGRARR